MTDTVALALAAAATVLATGLGALPVIALGAERVGKAHAGLSGFAAGAMGVAAIVGLLVPGLADGRPGGGRHWARGRRASSSTSSGEA